MNTLNPDKRVDMAIENLKRDPNVMKQNKERILDLLILDGVVYTRQ